MRQKPSTYWFEKDWAGAVFFLVLVILFYPELALVRSAPLVSDHWQQHYPWALALYQAVQQRHLPFWTPLIHCGFPLAAESQIAIFYIPNLVLDWLLPFRASYAYTVLIHFTLSGIGTAFYARSVGLRAPAAWFAAVIFVFGTSYGGAYYNITSLKTLAWFPYLLWMFEVWMRKNRHRFLWVWAFLASQLLMAGYLQVGTLVIAIACLYAALRLWGVRRGRERRGRTFSLSSSAWMTGAVVVCAVLAGIQILLTLPLALLSNRTGMVEDYAYVGSLSPLALSTMLLPNLQGLFRGNCLYNGGLAFFCLTAACLDQRTRRGFVFRLWSILGLLTLFLALGQWSPLYVALIKISHFYSFRTPAKFLIFFNFSMGMLAAAGFQSLMGRSAQALKLAATTAKFFCRVLAALAVALLSVKALLQWGRPFLEWTGEFFLRKTIWGRAGHPHSFAVYREKLDSVLHFAAKLFSFDYCWTRWTAGVLLCYFIWAFTTWKGKLKNRGWLWAGLVLLAVDLYGFSYADIRSDFAPFPAANIPEVVQPLLEARQQRMLGRLVVLRSADESSALDPSANMLYGIETVGAYSPFVISRYAQTIGLFGSVNDSNQEQSPQDQFVLERLELLSALGVSHILSTHSIKSNRLELVWSGRDGRSTLYHLHTPPLRGYLVNRLEIVSDWTRLTQKLMTEHFDPHNTLLLEEKELPQGFQRPQDESVQSEGFVWPSAMTDESASFEIETHGPAFFVRPVTFFAGWRVTVNDHEQPILPAYGLFQAVWLKQPGRYRLEFYYDPRLALRSVLKLWMPPKT